MHIFFQLQHIPACIQGPQLQNKYLLIGFTSLIIETSCLGHKCNQMGIIILLCFNSLVHIQLFKRLLQETSFKKPYKQNKQFIGFNFRLEVFQNKGEMK